ncbi:MAG: peptidoglycan DD-metalloendopeptidase family protein [Prevotellaceae bacterium]|jgi:murein DD-endopeptidase MepM/ murein hydrolase activator NlpD|nr:peptidoglycan DD-metalloendopeptidase family protein [Prevotellaceae bacterium]
MKKKSIIAIVVVALVAIIGVLIWKFYPITEKVKVEEAAVIIEELPILEYGIPIDSFDVEDGVIKQGQVLSQLFSNHGASAANITQLSLLTKDDFDFRTIKAGHTYKAFRSLDSTRALKYFAYEISPIEYAVFHLNDTFKIEYGAKPLTVERKLSEAAITTSLWNAVAEKGITRTLSLDLSDIYAWSIDFFGLQKGDNFTAIYDERFVNDSVSMGVDHIYAARFNHSGKDYYAFYFVQDSIGSYFDEQGNSLKKAFLKAPLKFSRISSHFTHARKHPILKIVRPHTGVDYAAPAGTPVMTIGDGAVIEKKYTSGGGNTVKIKHNSIYTTAYLHLQGYAKGINVGTRVSQGQVIGYVGSTGLSTGPHLDFRVWKSGSPINPLTMKSPPVEPVKEENRAAYDSLVNIWVARLNKEEDFNDKEAFVHPLLPIEVKLPNEKSAE